MLADGSSSLKSRCIPYFSPWRMLRADRRCFQPGIPTLSHPEAPAPRGGRCSGSIRPTVQPPRCWKQTSLGLRVYFGTYRDGEISLVFNRGIKSFLIIRGTRGEGKVERYAFTVNAKKQRPLYRTGSNDVPQSLYLKASWLAEK